MNQVFDYLVDFLLFLFWDFVNAANIPNRLFEFFEFSEFKHQGRRVRKKEKYQHIKKRKSTDDEEKKVLNILEVRGKKLPKSPEKYKMTQKNVFANLWILPVVSSLISM